jgi:LysR family hydrogen peroxide-inducible transcriptional activator
MNLRDLQYLVAVADLNSFSKAAEHCCISQPTLSAQIKKLEEELGVAVFERSAKKVLTTDIGEQIIATARRALRAADDMRELAASAQDPLAGKCRLGAFPTIASYLFADLVPELHQRLPKLKLILLEEKTDFLLDKLRRAELDIALLALPVEDVALNTMPLFDDAFYLAVNEQHELAGRDSISQGELARHKLLLLEDGHCLRDQALDVCHINGGGADPEFRASSLETVRQLVRAGTGVTLIPEIARNENDGLCYIPFESPAPKRTIGLVWRRCSARGALVESIAEIVRELKTGAG